MHAKILGIDIGATTVKYAELNEIRSLSGRGVQKVASEENAALVRQLAGIIALPEFSGCTAVGIGSPGPLDIERGVIIGSANMPQIRDCEVIPELKKIFPQKAIRLDNDANVATLGAQFFGAGKGLSDFAVLTLGTGVGGGCIYEKKLRRGLNGNFFEVGHIPIGGLERSGINTRARLCGCGNRGCLEIYASATGISFSYQEATGAELAAAEISTLARGGDARAIEAYRLAGAALGLGCATITQLMNITHFIFTGGVAAAEGLLRPALADTYRSHTFSMFHPLVKMEFTKGDENAGILGAAALFLDT
jgi:glucokinase